MKRIATVGTFDGVHRGHEEVLRVLRSEAERRSLRPCVFTFDAHPLEVVAPRRAPHRLMTSEAECHVLRTYGVEVQLLHFDHDMQRTTALEWMRHLRDACGVEALVMGYDNTFGSDGVNLDIGNYRALGATLGIEVIEAPIVDGVSSSAIRHALDQGLVAEANAMLGHPFAMEGTVVSGDSLGRTIGVPTANLRLPERQLVPKEGVYAARVEANGLSHSAVLNIGRRPTLGDHGERRVEVHLLDFAGDLYGATLRVEPALRLRDERKFASLSDLKHQIDNDIAAAREALATQGAERVECSA